MNKHDIKNLSQIKRRFYQSRNEKVSVPTCCRFHYVPLCNSGRKLVSDMAYLKTPIKYNSAAIMLSLISPRPSAVQEESWEKKAWTPVRLANMHNELLRIQLAN